MLIHRESRLERLGWRWIGLLMLCGGTAGLIAPIAVHARDKLTITTSCTQSVAKVQICVDSGCTDIAYSCAPYACEAQGSTCNTDALCATNADCAAGAACDANGRCVFISQVCKDDFTVKATDGTESSCAPYKCLAGACQQQCAGATECQPGYTCDGHVCRPGS